MSDPEAFVDIHCHLLPEIDDGAGSWQQSLAMAQMAVADGISTIIVTPHQLGNFAHNGGEMIRRQTARLQHFLDENGVPLRVLPGADVRIEPEMVKRIRDGDVLSLADHRRHVLLELPHELYLPLEPVLDELQAAGMVGILSHPERNHGILAAPRVLAPLVDRGCLMQVTAGSLMGTFGPASRQLAESMLQQGLVHFLATDAHGVKSRRPLLRRAYERAAELTDVRTAAALCCHNPARVAEGAEVDPGRVHVRRGGLAGWLRRRKAG